MLDLTTPSLLFSAISLILLAYTNRFLSYASVVRTLKENTSRHTTRKILHRLQTSANGFT